MTTIEKFNDSVMHTYGRYDLVMESGSGREAVDENNKKYIDFGSGIGTNSLGYCDEEWADAVSSARLPVMTRCSSETAGPKLTNVPSR